MKEYAFNGLAGCVAQTKARQTGTLVGVYHGEQSGLEADLENPWVTVCEAHHNLVSHPTLKLAKSHAADPKGWCSDCGEENPTDES